MEKYSHYQPTNIPWLGSIPEGWRLTTLETVVTLENGEQKIGEGVYLDAKFLRGQAEGTILESGQFVRKGERVILVDGENSGEVFILPQDGYMGSTFRRLCINSKLNQSYVAYVLSQYQEKLRTSKTGTAIPHLNKKEFFALSVPLPPLAVQQRIVDYLDEKCGAIDRLIATQTQRSALIQELRQSLISRTVTQGLDASVPMQSTAFPYRSLGEVCEIKNGYAFQSKKYVDHGIRVVRISDVQKGEMSNKDLKFYPLDSANELKRYMLYSGDLVMSLTGNAGRVAMLSDADVPAALNQRVACIRVKDERRVLIRFLFYYFDQDTFEASAMENATGAGQKNMSTTWLAGVSIPLPPLTVQQQIVTYLDEKMQQYDTLEASLHRQIELLTELKQSLITEVVTGQMKV